ncbi:hypothetical protein [Nonomuraea salmonea]|uniref:Uncharacterized protein n=1 Tax=Nonomuraea salmonea TaxID=46181 RepID=A0ABV5NGQ8_9ACTN
MRMPEVRQPATPGDAGGRQAPPGGGPAEVQLVGQVGKISMSRSSTPDLLRLLLLKVIFRVSPLFQGFTVLDA